MVKSKHQDSEQFGDLLRRIRDEMRVLQGPFADFFGVSTRTLSGWEMGHAFPSKARSLLIVSALRGRANPVSLFELASLLGVAHEVAGVAPGPPEAPAAPDRSAVSIITLADLRARMEGALFLAAEETDAPARALRRAVIAALDVAAACGATLEQARAAMVPAKKK